MGIAGRGHRVLIADDQPDIRRLLADRLGLDPGLEVVGEASNGAETITKVGELRPAALILDLQMPVMSGEEAIPILRSLDPELRILAFSAFVGVQEALFGSWRPDAEVAKGGDLRLLVQEIHRLLAGRPEDVMDFDLGIFEVGVATRALAGWSRIHHEVRALTPAGGPTSDLLALTGVFLSLGEQVRQASALGLDESQLVLSTRRAAAQGARRALDALEPALVLDLGPLHASLLASLPGEAGTPPASAHPLGIQPFA